jgi:Concanavalin A-like lectin/glucanases superfamily
MESNSNSSPIMKMLPVFTIFLCLLGLYYLYQYLFGPRMNNSFPLITSTQSAQTDPAKPITFTTTQLAPLYEGGEFSISTWIYLSNWSYRAGYNKPILSIGGKSFDTIRIYLGAYKPKLMVRLHTKDGTGPATGGAGAGTGAGSGGEQPESNGADSLNLLFNTKQIEEGLLNSTNICDIPELPMQRWVNVTVAVNGKVTDVYVDGKLSRSCVLPNPFKVDTSGYTATLLNYGGFGGQISTTTMYDTALNPEIIYKNYMAGPEPITSISGLFTSFFAPSVNTSVTA